MTGQMIEYIGIGIVIISIILEIVFTIVFKHNRKRKIKQIYESYDKENTVF